MMCCNYPTTTVAIDDEIDFLRTITQHLGIKDCISYSSPNKAIEALKDQKTFNRIQSRILKNNIVTEDINLLPEDHAVLINLKGLHEEIYTKDRFSDVSALIVDYYMDEMSGIDVCEALVNHPAKKILLTGGADKEKVAIEAFNKGIIHRFISKSDPDFPNKLKQAITLLKDAYFRDLTAILLSNITTGILQNSCYINFIRNLQDQYNAEEYYLLDTSGSIVFLDAQGLPVWLIIKHESEINNHEQFAIDQDADKNLIRKLAHREIIPFFFADEDYQYPVSEWDNFSYQSHPLPGVTGYYYAIKQGHIRNNLNKEKIIPYRAIQNETQL